MTYARACSSWRPPSKGPVGRASGREENMWKLEEWAKGAREQAMVHAAAAYARQKNRLQTLICTSSIGPGATNMVTGAALATINRLPVLLLPSDVFSTRAASPLLQELEASTSYDVSVN